MVLSLSVWDSVMVHGGGESLLERREYPAAGPSGPFRRADTPFFMGVGTSARCGCAPALVNVVPHEHPVLLLALLFRSGKDGGRTGCALTTASMKNPENRQQNWRFFFGRRRR